MKSSRSDIMLIPKIVNSFPFHLRTCQIRATHFLSRKPTPTGVCAIVDLELLRGGLQRKEEVRDPRGTCNCSQAQHGEKESRKKNIRYFQHGRFPMFAIDRCLAYRRAMARISEEKYLKGRVGTLRGTRPRGQSEDSAIGDVADHNAPVSRQPGQDFSAISATSSRSWCVAPLAACTAMPCSSVET